MLIVVPPSETKARSPVHGAPVDLQTLAFPDLTPLRRAIAAALQATCERPDAFERLYVRPSMVHDVAMNTHLLAVPAQPVESLYAGPLHQGLDLAGLSARGEARARRGLVFTSALWGLLRPGDRIPRYRLHLHARLVGIDRLDHAWRAVLPGALEQAAGSNELVVDLRSPVYHAMGMAPAARTVTLRVDRGSPGARIGDVIAKRVHGEAAHFLLESGAEPRDPEELAEVLADRWPVQVRAPERRSDPWSMIIAVAT